MDKSQDGIAIETITVVRPDLCGNIFKGQFFRANVEQDPNIAFRDLRGVFLSKNIIHVIRYRVLSNDYLLYYSSTFNFALN